MEEEGLDLVPREFIRRQISLEFAVGTASEDALDNVTNQLQKTLSRRLPVWHPGSTKHMDSQMVVVKLEKVTARSQPADNPHPEALTSLRTLLPDGVWLIRGLGTSRNEPIATRR